MIRGIDISSHQPFPDFGAIAQARDFVIIKATGGTGYRNPRLDAQRAGARAAGLLTGYYHYLFEEGYEGTGQREAAYFVNNLPPLEAGETLWLDVEQRHTPADGRPYVAHVAEWLAFVHAATGVVPGIYTGNYFVQEANLKAPALGGYPLWLASWQATRPPVPDGGPWRRIAVWQYSDDETIAGVQYDGNSFDGTREEFMALGKQVPAPKVDEGFRHAEGFLSPVSDTFDWGGAGIVTYRKIRVYNDEERKHYEREWDAATGFTPWLEVA